MHTVKYARGEFNVLNQTMCVGVILAGGQSRRMGGGDKCLLGLHEKTIVQHAQDRAQAQVNRLLLNCNGEETRFSFIGLPIVKDIFEGWRGPLAGIHASLNWMTRNHPSSKWLASFAADTPFFPENLVARLLEHAASNSCDIVVATHKNKMQPLFALWNISLRHKLEEHLQNNGNPKMQDWIKSQQHICVEFENAYQDPFFNINTPADFSAAESMAIPKSL